MLGIAQWIALIGMVVIGALFVNELRKWRVPGCVIGKRHRMLRVALVVLFELLFTLIFIGPMVVNPKDMFSDLLYWSICLILGVAVVVLALFDVREVTKEIPAIGREVFHDVFHEDERGGK